MPIRDVDAEIAIHDPPLEDAICTGLDDVWRQQIEAEALMRSDDPRAQVMLSMANNNREIEMKTMRGIESQVSTLNGQTPFV